MALFVSSNRIISLTVEAKELLAHWDRGKMDAISQTTFSSAISWKRIFEFRKKNSRKFVPKGPIDNIPALV